MSAFAIKFGAQAQVIRPLGYAVFGSKALGRQCVWSGGCSLLLATVWWLYSLLVTLDLASCLHLWFGYGLVAQLVAGKVRSC